MIKMQKDQQKNSLRSDYMKYFRETENLGEDIQTYAALRFLPSVDYII